MQLLLCSRLQFPRIDINYSNQSSCELIVRFSARHALISLRSGDEKQGTRGRTTFEMWVLQTVWCSQTVRCVLFRLVTFRSASMRYVYTVTENAHYKLVSSWTGHIINTVTLVEYFTSPTKEMKQGLAVIREHILSSVELRLVMVSADCRIEQSFLQSVGPAANVRFQGALFERPQPPQTCCILTFYKMPKPHTHSVKTVLIG